MASNTNKTKVMLITIYEKRYPLRKNELTVYCYNTLLKNVTLLGVHVDKYLTWKYHVTNTTKLISRNITLLRYIKNYLSQQIRVTFYNAYIQPHFDYCNTIWSQFTKVSKIHILQTMSLRILMDKPNFTYSSLLFDHCGVMAIQRIVQFRLATMIYRTVNGLSVSF